VTWSRRDLLRLLGASPFVSLLGCGTTDPIDIPADATFDDVLDIIHRNDVEFGGGLSNHAPMAAEALVALGLSDRVAAWVASYAAALPPFEASEPLTDDERAAARGAIEQRFAWIAAYEIELETVSSRDLVARDFVQLSAGYASVHGVLRIAHAMRSLERADTPARRRELAFGLGYLAASYTELPGTPGARARRGLDVVAALDAVPLVPQAERTGGLILDRFAVLDGRAGFIDAIEAVDLDALPVDEAISSLCAAAARLFVHGGSTSITYLHALTGTSALRLIPLDDASARIALGHAFQAVAAAYAVTARTSGIPGVVASGRHSIDELVDIASRTSNEHRIKLTEACLREHAHREAPELLAAASLAGDL
jgi:hypothetical protein